MYVLLEQNYFFLTDVFAVQRPAMCGGVGHGRQVKVYVHCTWLPHLQGRVGKPYLGTI